MREIEQRTRELRKESEQIRIDIERIRSDTERIRRDRAAVDAVGRRPWQENARLNALLPLMAAQAADDSF